MTTFTRNADEEIIALETMEDIKNALQSLESKGKLRAKENGEPGELHSFMYASGMLETLAIMINTMNNCGFAQDEKIRHFAECVVSNLYPTGIPTEPRGW
jgi:hypothetical protein